MPQTARSVEIEGNSERRDVRTQKEHTRGGCTLREREHTMLGISQYPANKEKHRSRNLLHYNLSRKEKLMNKENYGN